jgi:hypothetical protein
LYQHTSYTKKKVSMAEQVAYLLLVPTKGLGLKLGFGQEKNYLYSFDKGFGSLPGSVI